MNFNIEPKKQEWKGQGWTVTTLKGPILNAQDIDNAEKNLGIPIPEMIFGKNKVSIEHEKSGFEIHFTALNALDLVDKTGDKGLIQVAHSKAWSSTRNKNRSAAGDKIEGIIKPFDWTYSTDYCGDVCDSKTMDDNIENVPEIPFDKLKQPDPILFFDEVSLYEDELGDNGIVILNCKVRVMPERLLVLCRFFLRVDNVLLRIRDTRVYVEFETGQVIREYQEQEENFDELKKKIPLGVKDPGSYLRDANWVASKLKVLGGRRDGYKV